MTYTFNKGNPTQLGAIIQAAQTWYSDTRVPAVVYWNPEKEAYDWTPATNGTDTLEIVAEIPYTQPPVQCDGGEPGA